MLTKTHRHAASIVRAIKDGQWTNTPPDWVKPYDYGNGFCIDAYARAVQTAEAFCILFHTDPLFDELAFLRLAGFRQVKP